MFWSDRERWCCNCVSIWTARKSNDDITWWSATSRFPRYSSFSMRIEFNKTKIALTKLSVNFSWPLLHPPRFSYLSINCDTYHFWLFFFSHWSHRCFRGVLEVCRLWIRIFRKICSVLNGSYSNFNLPSLAAWELFRVRCIRYEHTHTHKKWIIYFHVNGGMSAAFRIKYTSFREWIRWMGRKMR